MASLREGLALIVEEGLEEIIMRHKLCANRLYEGLEKMGLELFVEESHKRLPTVTTIKVPGNINWMDVLNYAMKKYFKYIICFV